MTLKSKSPYPIAKRPKILLVDEAGNRLIYDQGDGKMAIINAEGRIVNDAGIKNFVRRAQRQGFDIHQKKKGNRSFFYGTEADRAGSGFLNY